MSRPGSVRCRGIDAGVAAMNPPDNSIDGD